ncbi:unnamed protein product [Moneuplotes crassus]|uniref:Uncharacterized protein n=1 Tax=Euplotes crassus TaxID=5936 RepID=A0AAD1U3J5_EUPCR|nr:unnamed protein product [Moneuplotes crassus]
MVVKDWNIDPLPSKDKEDDSMTFHQRLSKEEEDTKKTYLKRGFNATYIETEDIHLQRRLEEGYLQKGIREWANARYESRNKRIPFIPPIIKDTVKQKIDKTLKRIHEEELQNRKSRRIIQSTKKKKSKKKNFNHVLSVPKLNFRNKKTCNKEDIKITINSPKEKFTIPNTFRLGNLPLLSTNDRQEVGLKISRQSKKQASNTMKTPHEHQKLKFEDKIKDFKYKLSRKISIKTEDILSPGVFPPKFQTKYKQPKLTTRKSIVKKFTLKNLNDQKPKISTKNIQIKNKLSGYNTIQVAKGIDSDKLSSTTSKNHPEPDSPQVTVFNTMQEPVTCRLPSLRGSKLNKKECISNANSSVNRKSLNRQKSKYLMSKYLPENNKTRRMSIFMQHLEHSKRKLMISGLKPEPEEEKDKTALTTRSVLDMQPSRSSPIPTISPVKFRRRMGVDMSECNEGPGKMDEENTNEIDSKLKRQDTKCFKNQLQRLASKPTMTHNNNLHPNYHPGIAEESSSKSSSQSSRKSSFFSIYSTDNVPENPSYIDMIKRMSSKISEGSDTSSVSSSSKKNSTKPSKKHNLDTIIEQCENLLQSDLENYTEIDNIKKYMNLVNKYFKNKVDYMNYFNNETID